MVQKSQVKDLLSDLFKELYEANPKSVQLKHGLAVSYYKLAGIYSKENKKVAREYYHQTATLWEELYELTKPKEYQEYVELCKEDSL